MRGREDGRRAGVGAAERARDGSAARCWCAGAMPSVPALCEDMSRKELKQYLKEYSTESGQKLFAAANVDMLEHLSMSTIYEASKSVAKWEPVANMPSRPCSDGLASGAHRGTSRRAAGAGSLFTEG